MASCEHGPRLRLAVGLTSFFSLVLWFSCAAGPPTALAGLVSLARAAVVAEVTGTTLPPIRAHTPPQPVFVTVEKKGKVLGCRGALECRTRSLEEEVALAARAAAAHDPRYPPLRPADLAGLQVTVTVIARLEPLDHVESLGPAEGLVLKSGGRTGVVLPWEGKDPKVRLEWAYRKAGAPVGSACELLRMKAERIRG